jgi:phage terminase small subunit
MMDYIKVQSDGTAYTDHSSLTREQAGAIQEITVDEYVEGRGDEARIVKKVKIKLSEKRGSLELIGRHLGMFPTRITGADGGPVQIQEAPSIDVSKLEPGEAQALLDLMEKATARPNKGGNS